MMIQQSMLAETRLLKPVAQATAMIQRSMLAETRLLKPVAQATVPARTKSFNIAEFYRTGPGLYVFCTFQNRLNLRAGQMVEPTPERPYVALLLKVNAFDRDVQKELPGTHLAGFEDIASLIEAQPNGQAGFLLSNGHANTFYVEGKNGEVFAARVSWHLNNREWRIFYWGLSVGSKWDSGLRVLCPGNVVF